MAVDVDLLREMVRESERPIDRQVQAMAERNDQPRRRHDFYPRPGDYWMSMTEQEPEEFELADPGIIIFSGTDPELRLRIYGRLWDP